MGASGDMDSLGVVHSGMNKTLWASHVSPSLIRRFLLFNTGYTANISPL